jgi:hypothetical protein
MSIHDDWPEPPAWTDTETITGYGGTDGSNPDEQVERRYELEVAVGQATARIEEDHLRMEGGEGAGLIERVGPYVHIGPEDLSPEMAVDALEALAQLLEKIGASARS